MPDIAKERFIAYFAGGDKDKADELLKRYRIKDGLDGLDFSESTIDDAGNLSLKVTYTVEYLFDYKGFDLEALTLTSTASSKTWKEGELNDIDTNCIYGNCVFYCQLCFFAYIYCEKEQV